VLQRHLIENGVTSFHQMLSPSMFVPIHSFVHSRLFHAVSKTP
jgi:hypothetical protein